MIAERLANDVKLHFLDIVATFHEKAEEEGIDIEELNETLENAKWSTARLMQIDKSLSVNSAEDLLKLANVTIGLLTLSQVDTAEQAQRWIYKLPALYQNRLEQQHLATANIEVTFKISLNTSWHTPGNWHTTSQKVVIRPSGEVEKPLLDEATKTLVTWWGQQPERSVHVYSKTGETSLPSVM